MTHDQLASDAVELLPCPFCGGEARIVSERLWDYVICAVCSAQGAKHSVNPTAVVFWNTRTPSPSTVHTDDAKGITSVPTPDVHNDAAERRVGAIARSCPKCRTSMAWRDCVWNCTTCWHIEAATEAECQKRSSDSEDPRVEPIARWLCSRFSAPDQPGVTLESWVNDQWRKWRDIAHCIIAADPLTAAHAETVTDLANAREVLTAMDALMATKDALLAECGVVMRKWRDASVTAAQFDQAIEALLSRIEGAAK